MADKRDSDEAGEQELDGTRLRNPDMVTIWYTAGPFAFRFRERTGFINQGVCDTPEKRDLLKYLVHTQVPVYADKPERPARKTGEPHG